MLEIMSSEYRSNFDKIFQRPKRSGWYEMIELAPGYGFTLELVHRIVTIVLTQLATNESVTFKLHGKEDSIGLMQHMKGLTEENCDGFFRPKREKKEKKKKANPATGSTEVQ